jgi:dephospho-CoA kinase
MKKIGIAGTIAAGKTTFSILLRRRGYPVFNSDQYAKLTRHNGHPACEKIKEVFPGTSDEQGDIDAKKLADIVFHDEDRRKQLNGIVHPYVIEGMRKFFASHQEMAFVFAEVPLLFEAGLQDEFDEIVVVTCKENTAVKRMMQDRGYTHEEALARYHSQIHMEEQVAQADTVIHNDGSLADLDHEVNLYLARLRRENRRKTAC